MTGEPAAKAGYRWLFVEGLGQEKAHQFPEPVEPDDEGVLTALCGREAMAFRTLDGYRLPACFDCLVAHGAGEADRLEDWAARMAAATRVTPDSAASRMGDATVTSRVRGHVDLPGLTGRCRG